MATIFSKNLRFLRKQKGWGQDELAKRTNRSQPTIQLWESDKRSPTMEMVTELADIFNVDVTEAIVGGVTGSEAAYGPNIIAGIEVTLGVFGASGKLPVSIPKLEGTSYSDQIVYKRGYGLTYHSKTLDFDVLKNKIKEAKAISADDYTAESYELLMAEVEKAEALLSDMNVTQAEINHQVDLLNQAIKALVSNKKDDTDNNQNKPPKDETDNNQGNDGTTQQDKNNPITNTGARESGSNIVIYLLLGAMFVFFRKMDRISE